MISKDGKFLSLAKIGLNKNKTKIEWDKRNFHLFLETNVIPFFDNFKNAFKNKTGFDFDIEKIVCMRHVFRFLETSEKIYDQIMIVGWKGQNSWFLFINTSTFELDFYENFIYNNPYLNENERTKKFNHIYDIKQSYETGFFYCLMDTFEKTFNAFGDINHPPENIYKVIKLDGSQNDNRFISFISFTNPKNYLPDEKSKFEINKIIELTNKNEAKNYINNKAIHRINEIEEDKYAIVLKLKQASNIYTYGASVYFPLRYENRINSTEIGYEIPKDVYYRGKKGRGHIINLGDEIPKVFSEDLENWINPLPTFDVKGFSIGQTSDAFIWLGKILNNFNEYIWALGKLNSILTINEMTPHIFKAEEANETERSYTNSFSKNVSIINANIRQDVFPLFHFTETYSKSHLVDDYSQPTAIVHGAQQYGKTTVTETITSTFQNPHSYGTYFEFNFAINFQDATQKQIANKTKILIDVDLVFKLKNFSLYTNNRHFWMVPLTTTFPGDWALILSDVGRANNYNDTIIKTVRLIALMNGQEYKGKLFNKENFKGDSNKEKFLKMEYYQYPNSFINSFFENRFTYSTIIKNKIVFVKVSLFVPNYFNPGIETYVGIIAKKTDGSFEKGTHFNFSATSYYLAHRYEIDLVVKQINWDTPPPITYIKHIFKIDSGSSSAKPFAQNIVAPKVFPDFVLSPHCVNENHLQTVISDSQTKKTYFTNFVLRKAGPDVNQPSKWIKTTREIDYALDAQYLNSKNEFGYAFIKRQLNKDTFYSYLKNGHLVYDFAIDKKINGFFRNLYNKEDLFSAIVLEENSLKLFQTIDNPIKNHINYETKWIENYVLTPTKINAKNDNNYIYANDIKTILVTETGFTTTEEFHNNFSYDFININEILFRNKQNITVFINKINYQKLPINEYTFNYDFNYKIYSENGFEFCDQNKIYEALTNNFFKNENWTDNVWKLGDKILNSKLENDELILTCDANDFVIGNIYILKKDNLDILKIKLENKHFINNQVKIKIYWRL